jgi:hypothetical protein
MEKIRAEKLNGFLGRNFLEDILPESIFKQLP